MTAEMFVKLAEEYFGEYRPVVKHEVMHKLFPWEPWAIAALWDEARETIESKYKTPPDIYFIQHSATIDARIENRRQLRIENRTRELMGGTRKAIAYEGTEYAPSVVEAFFNALPKKDTKL